MTTLRAEEASVEARSASLKRELGVPNLALTQISIVFVGAATLALGIDGLIGVGKQEAFQLLWNASAIFYGLTYLVMFAIPLIGLRDRAERPPWWLRAAALSGFLMTALYVTLSVLPIVQVESRLLFTSKICALIAVTNAIGLAIFFGKRARS